VRIRFDPVTHSNLIRSPIPEYPVTFFGGEDQKLPGSPVAGYTCSFKQSRRPHEETDDAEDQRSTAASCQRIIDPEDRNEPRRRAERGQRVSEAD
jgi:hypothetical protein